MYIIKSNLLVMSIDFFRVFELPESRGHNYVWLHSHDYNGYTVDIKA